MTLKVCVFRKLTACTDKPEKVAGVVNVISSDNNLTHPEAHNSILDLDNIFCKFLEAVGTLKTAGRSLLWKSLSKS